MKFVDFCVDNYENLVYTLCNRGNNSAKTANFRNTVETVDPYVVNFFITSIVDSSI